MFTMVRDMHYQNYAAKTISIKLELTTEAPTLSVTFISPPFSRYSETSFKMFFSLDCRASLICSCVIPE